METTLFFKDCHSCRGTPPPPSGSATALGIYRVYNIYCLFGVKLEYFFCTFFYHIFISFFQPHISIKTIKHFGQLSACQPKQIVFLYPTSTIVCDTRGFRHTGILKHFIKSNHVVPSSNILDQLGSCREQATDFVPWSWRELFKEWGNLLLFWPNKFSDYMYKHISIW